MGVRTTVTETSITLEGAVFDLEGTVKIEDKFEISFDTLETLESFNCPVLPTLSGEQKAMLDKESSLLEDHKETMLKRRLSSTSEDDEANSTSNGLAKKFKAFKRPEPFVLKYYSFIADLNISENKLIKAELCGLHLAQKLKEKGADILINQCKAIIGNKMA